MDFVVTWCPGLAFRSAGVSVDLGSILVIQAMATVAFVLALTPGNIGIKEGSIVLAASVLGIEPQLALLASLIDRGAALVVNFRNWDLQHTIPCVEDGGGSR